MDTETVRKLKMLEEAVFAAPDRPAKVEALNAFAWELHTSDCARGISLAEQAGCLARELGDIKGQATSLRTLGWECYSLGRHDEALEYLEEALPLCRACGEVRLEVQVLNNFGVVYDSLGQCARALECYFQVLAIIQAGAERRGEGTLLNNIGYVYMTLGDYDAAMEHFTRALDLARAPGEGARSNQTYPLSNIGQLCERIGDHVRALQAYQECFEIYRDLGNTMGQAEMLACVASACHALGRDDDAGLACRDGLALARTNGYRLQEASLLQAEACLIADGGQVQEALSRYRTALGIAVQTQEHGLEVDILGRIGRLHLHLGDLEEAGAALQRAQLLAEESGAKEALVRAHEALAEVHERLGDAPLALSHYRQFHQREKEIFNDRADQRTRALVVRLEVTKAQQEMELHRVRNVELATANQRLQEQAGLLQAQAEELHAQREELQAQAEELERQATTDDLTGLYNRRYLEEILARQFSLSQRSRLPLTVVMIDVDHFKRVNDAFGHQTGDAVLRAVGHLLRSACRISDIAARYGGEEFLLTLLGTCAAEAAEFCERLRRQVEAHPWASIHPDLMVTVSIGLSDETSGMPTPQCLLELADQKLYEAKHAGRNRVCGTPRLAPRPVLPTADGRGR